MQDRIEVPLTPRQRTDSHHRADRLGVRRSQCHEPLPVKDYSDVILADLHPNREDSSSRKTPVTLGRRSLTAHRPGLQSDGAGMAGYTTIATPGPPAPCNRC